MKVFLEQITPYQTPVGKTPKRKTAARKPGQPKFFDDEVGTEDKTVASGGASNAPMLNSLVYKQVVQLVKEKEQVINYISLLCTVFIRIKAPLECNHFHFNVMDLPILASPLHMQNHCDCLQQRQDSYHYLLLIGF